MTLPYLAPRIRESRGTSWIEEAAHARDGLSAVIAHVVPLLDGTRRLEDVCGAMFELGIGLDQTFAALAWLEAHAMVEEGRPCGLSTEELRLHAGQIRTFEQWSDEGQRPAEELAHSVGVVVQLALKEAVVLVVGGGASGASLARSLCAMGVGTLILADAESGRDRAPQPNDSFDRTGLASELASVNPFANVRWGSFRDVPTIVPAENHVDLLVYCSDRFDGGLCRNLNELCVAHGTTWIPFRRDIHAIDMGPLIVPHETPCFECYERRVDALAHAPADDPASSRSDPRVELGLVLPLGVDLLCLEIVKILSSVIDPVTYGRLWRLNIYSGLQELHPILKLPRCKVCGTYRKRPPRQLWRELDA